MKFCEKNVLCEKGDEITRFDGSKHRSIEIVLVRMCVQNVHTGTSYTLAPTYVLVS